MWPRQTAAASSMAFCCELKHETMTLLQVPFPKSDCSTVPDRPAIGRLRPAQEALDFLHVAVSLSDSVFSKQKKQSPGPPVKWAESGVRAERAGSSLPVDRIN